MADDDKIQAPITDRRLHSHVYAGLVSADDDLVGLVAYGIYQQRKRRWIANFEYVNKHLPSDQQVAEYCFGYQSQELAELRRSAENLLYAILDNLNVQNRPKLIADAFNARATAELEHLVGKIDEISGYRHHIVGHVVGFLVLVVFVWLGSLILHYEPEVAKVFR